MRLGTYVERLAHLPSFCNRETSTLQSKQSSPGEGQGLRAVSKRLWKSGRRHYYLGCFWRFLSLQRYCLQLLRHVCKASPLLRTPKPNHAKTLSNPEEIICQQHQSCLDVNTCFCINQWFLLSLLVCMLLLQFIQKLVVKYLPRANA